MHANDFFQIRSRSGRKLKNKEENKNIFDVKYRMTQLIIILIVYKLLSYKQ